MKIAALIARHLAVAIVVTMSAVAVAAAPPVVQLSKESLTVSGVTPGGSVAMLSIAREPLSYMARVVSRRELLRDEDRNGRVRYAPQAGIAYSSIWIVVDLATGESALSMPDGVTPLLMEQRGAGRGNAVESIVNSVEVGRTSIDVLIVRPGVGAWSLKAREGSEADKDGQVNGRLRVDLSRLQPLDSAFGSAPNSLKRGDVVALLDAERMEYWLQTVKGDN